MAGLRLGPLLRYTGGSSATVWVETSRPCTAEVRCADGSGGSTRTFQIAGHHYALVEVNGLTPGRSTPYEVYLDGTRAWPSAGSPFPPSEIRTRRIHRDAAGAAGAQAAAAGASGGAASGAGAGDGDTAGPLRIAFGSCRWAAPPAGGSDPAGPDALDALAARLAAGRMSERPDVLLLLGDQVYADETSRATRRWLAARRDLSEPPGSEVADFEEYTRLYHESWLDPEVRWLLSTVPTCMIFDDHDVIDDWNTSAAWLADMRATPWWRERVLSGLMSYWVHQHLGNLTPADLAADPLYAAVRETPDGTEALRAFACRADTDPASVRWSYRRDFGRVRVLMVDSRAGRVLAEPERAMLDPGEARWLRAQALDTPDECDHLLIGTSLPWLLPQLVHDAEGWSAALCRGEKGPRWARFGERLRRAADLEHWAAFPESFEALTALVAEAGSGPRAPATVLVLSGDVHHAYLAEPAWPRHSGRPAARVLQLTCSPVRNAVPLSMRLGFRFGWSRLARALGRRFAGHGRVPKPSVDWHRRGGPWFGNQLMTLTLHGREATLRLDQARAVRPGRGGSGAAGEGKGQARLATVAETPLTPP